MLVSIDNETFPYIKISGLWISKLTCCSARHDNDPDEKLTRAFHCLSNHKQVRVIDICLGHSVIVFGPNFE